MQFGALGDNALEYRVFAPGRPAIAVQAVDKGRTQAETAPLNRKGVEHMLGHGAGRLRALRDRALLGMAHDTL